MSSPGYDKTPNPALQGTRDETVRARASAGEGEFGGYSGEAGSFLARRDEAAWQVPCDEEQRRQRRACRINWSASRRAVDKGGADDVIGRLSGGQLTANYRRIWTIRAFILAILDKTGERDKARNSWCSLSTRRGHISSTPWRMCHAQPDDSKGRCAR